MEAKTIGLGVCVIVAGILIVMAIGGFDTFAGQRRAGIMMGSDRVFIEQMPTTRMGEWYYTWYGTRVEGFSMRRMNQRF